MSIRNRRMSVKLIISMLLFVVASIAATAGIVTVLALASRSINSNVNIMYTAVDIDGEVEAAYKIGDNGEWVSMNGARPYRFSADDQTANKQMNPADIELTSQNRYVEFRYIFRNFGEVDYTAILSLNEVDESNNIKLDYKYNNKSYSPTGYGLVIEGTNSPVLGKVQTNEDGEEYVEMIYYVKATVKQLTKAASYESDFYWLLEKYEAQPGEESIRLAASNYIDNGDGTFSASYSGVNVSVASTMSGETKANIKNIWNIPSRFGSASVTKVVAGQDFTSNTKIIIPYSVTEIPNSTFRNQQKIISVAFTLSQDGTSNLTSIGNYAFNSTCINEIIIPNSIQTIGEYAFAGCDSLEKLNILGGNNLVIGKEAFTYLDNLQTVEIGEGLIEISSQAFAVDPKLSSVKTSSSLKIIGAYAFARCTSLSNFTFGKNLQQVGNFAFQGCNLAEVDIPSNVSVINQGTFAQCKNLSNLILNEGLTKIGDEAFDQCSNLTEVQIPSTVQNISSLAFGGCQSLKMVNILGGDNLVIGVNAFKGLKNLETVEIGEGVIEIGDFAFFGCSKLQNVNFPTSLISIGSAAFQYSYELNNIDLSNTKVITIGKAAFDGCSNVKLIKIPSSVTKINQYAFRDCYAVEEIQFNADLSSTPTDVNTYAFRNVGRDAEKCILYVGDNVTELTNYVFLDSMITNAYIPSTTTMVSYPFANNYRLAWCSWNGTEFVFGGSQASQTCKTVNLTRTEFTEILTDPAVLGDGLSYPTIYVAVSSKCRIIEIIKDLTLNETLPIRSSTTLTASKNVTITCNVENAVYVYEYLTIGEVGGNTITFKAGSSVTGYLFNINYGCLELNSAIIDGNGTAKGIIAGNEAAWNENPDYYACEIVMNGGEIKNCNGKEASAVGCYFSTYFEMTGGKIYNNKGVATSTSDKLYGAVVVSRGEFFMTGGEISNNTLTGKTGSILKSESYGAGLCMFDGGMFIMAEDAKFLNNKSSVGKTIGANIYIGENTLGAVCGGTIESTSSTADAMFGGGIASIGNLYILGGTIKNTKATTGGGIANGGNLYIAGGTITGCNSINSNGTPTTYGNAIATAKDMYLAGGNISGDIAIGYQSILISTTYGSLNVVSLLEISQTVDSTMTTQEEALDFFKDLTGVDYEGLKTPYTLTLCQLDSTSYEAKTESNFTSKYANTTKAIVTYSSAVAGSLSHFTLTSPTSLWLAMGSGSGYDTNSIYLKK